MKMEQKNILNLHIHLQYNKTKFENNSMDTIEKHGRAIYIAKKLFQQRTVLDDKGYLRLGTDKTLDDLHAIVHIDKNIDEIINLYDLIQGKRVDFYKRPEITIINQNVAIDVEQRQMFIHKIQELAYERNYSSPQELGAIIRSELSGAKIVKMRTPQEIEQERRKAIEENFYGLSDHLD